MDNKTKSISEQSRILGEYIYKHSAMKVELEGFSPSSHSKIDDPLSDTNKIFEGKSIPEKTKNTRIWDCLDRFFNAEVKSLNEIDKIVKNISQNQKKIIRLSIIKSNH
jgi:hypothetical protein